jgi:putative DNA primase/helicase
VKKVALSDIPADAPFDVTAFTGDGPVVPMPEPVQVPEDLRFMGEPDRVWIYRTPNGEAFGAVMRWDKGEKKAIRPVIWDGKAFVSRGLGDGRPLYNAEMLAATPMAPVLIVEGEKTAEAAAAFVPEGWIVTTWSGGSNAAHQSDWSLLVGHACVIWPDNDESGVKAGRQVQEYLRDLGVKSSLVPLSDALPKGWDLADELPGNLETGMIGKLISRQHKIALSGKEDAPVKLARKKAGADPDIDQDRRWRPLGYDQQTYYLMSELNLQVDPYEGGSLMTENTCLQIYPDRQYWADLQGSPGKPDWKMAGLQIMDGCRKAGVYDPKRLRGRGVWIDKADDGVERTVLNTGGQLLVSRPDEETKNIPFVRFKSRWIYEKKRELIFEADDYVTPASDDEGRMIREMCGKIRWESKIYADLLAGWLATAIVCGGLKWRTHCWVTGNQGSGKTQVVNRIVSTVLGDLAIYPLGATTEAGIRQQLRSDAVPVVFDESENSNYAEQRRQAVLGLMRQASSEGRGTIMKGGANHSGQEFAVRSSFLLSSIGVGLKEAADLTRTAVLTVRPLESYAPEQRDRLEANWHRLLDLQAMMPEDIPQRLLARQVRHMRELRANIEVFKQAATEIMNSPRIGDQLGTLLAGSWSLYNTDVMTVDQCKKYLERNDLEEFTAVKTEREDMALLHHICGAMLRVETVKGVQERTIGELLYIVMERPSESDMNPREAETTLARYGLRIEYCEKKHKPEGVWIGQKVPALNRIMQTSDYFEGWSAVLLRHPYAKRSDGTLRFGGVVSRAVYMPKPEWPIHEA